MWTWNPFTSNLDAIGNEYYKGVLSSAPVNPQDGMSYIDSNTGEMFYYFDGMWQLLNTFSIASYMLLETGDAFLLENDFKILVE